MSAPFPDLNAEYDEGYFDKDEQGWVADRTSIRCNPQTGEVTVRQWGDRNGLDPYDRTFDTRIVQVYPDLSLVKLEAQPWYFDLAKQRLVSGSRRVVLRTGQAPAGYRDPPRIQSLLAHLAELLALLTGTRVEAPPFSGWPARPATMTEWELTRLDVPAVDKVWATLQMRPPGLRAGEWLSVSLERPLHSAALAVEGTGFSLAVGGAPELHARAKQLTDAWTWA
ncbi:MAG: hypothetical protein U0228_00240 [Myxococcaceae bacterium]